VIYRDQHALCDDLISKFALKGFCALFYTQSFSHIILAVSLVMTRYR